MLLTVDELTEDLCESYMVRVVCGSRDLQQIEIKIKDTFYRFMPYHGPQICLRPVEGQAPEQMNKPWKYFGWVQGQMATNIKEWINSQ